MVEEIQTNIGSKSTILLQWGSLAQNFRWKGSPPTNCSSSQKT